MPQCAPLVGSSERQLTRWWAWSRRGGLGELLAEKRRRGKTSRLHPAADAGLEGELRAGRVATREGARRYLAERWGIAYGSVNGVWWQLRRQHGARPKTGRRRPARADPAAQAAFRRTLRGAAAG